MSTFGILLVLVPYIAIFILIIFLLIKTLKWKPQQTNPIEFEKIKIESEQLRKASIQQQQDIVEKFKEVKIRLASVEKILQEVE